MQVLNKGDRQKLEELFRKFDKDGSGQISSREFRIACKQFSASVTPSEIQRMICEERERLEEAFRRLDRNGDGIISLREFRIAVSQINPKISEYELQCLVADMDIDGNGMIDIEEFCLCMAKYLSKKSQQQKQASTSSQAQLSQKQLRDAFNYFDKDKSGSISQAELRQVMQTLNVRCNDKDFKAMVRSIDVNGDGHIDFEEFCTLLNSLY